MTDSPKDRAEELLLAARLEEFDAKVYSIASSQSGLSASGAATAIALLVTLNLDVFKSAARLLRARAGQS